MNRSFYLPLAGLSLSALLVLVAACSHDDDSSGGYRGGARTRVQTQQQTTTTTVPTVQPTPPPHETTVTRDVAPPPSAPVQQAPADYPYATPVAGKAGFVTSPYAPEAGLVDVRGMSPGQQAKDPYTGKIFLVP